MSERERFFEIIDDFDTCMMVSFTADGTPQGRPMNVAGRQDDALWFVTGRGSGKVEELATNHPAVLTFQSSDQWVSASGKATLVADRAKVEELFTEPMKAWFPDGPQDPDVVAIKVDLDHGEYQAVKGADKISFAFGMAKSLFTGSELDDDNSGEHGEVQL